MKLHPLAVLILFTCASHTISRADKASDLKPTLGKAGRVVAVDAFDAPALAKTWSIAKGDWQIRDGVLIGKELKSDNHPGVCGLNLPNHNSIIKFSFRLDGAKGFSLSYNQAKGHLFRVGVEAAGITVLKDKDKKDPASKSMELGKADVTFQSGQWYTLLVEVNGDKVAVQTDNGVKIAANDPTLDVDKTGYRFVARGESIAIDDIKATEFAP